MPYGISLAILILGGQAMSNDFLRILGVNQTVFLSMIICGAFLKVTASVGGAAAYSKNECLAFLVSYYVNLYRPLNRLPYLKVDLVLRANEELQTENRVSYQIEMVYKQGIQMLCKPACKCNADPLKWANDTRRSMSTDRLGVSSIAEFPMDFLNSYQHEKIV